MIITSLTSISSLSTVYIYVLNTFSISSAHSLIHSYKNNTQIQFPIRNPSSKYRIFGKIYLKKVFFSQISFSKHTHPHTNPSSYNTHLCQKKRSPFLPSSATSTVFSSGVLLQFPKAPHPFKFSKNPSVKLTLIALAHLKT